MSLALLGLLLPFGASGSSSIMELSRVGGGAAAEIHMVAALFRKPTQGIVRRECIGVAAIVTAEENNPKSLYFFKSRLTMQYAAHLDPYKFGPRLRALKKWEEFLYIKESFPRLTYLLDEEETRALGVNDPKDAQGHFTFGDRYEQPTEAHITYNKGNICVTFYLTGNRAVLGPRRNSIA